MKINITEQPPTIEEVRRWVSLKQAKESEIRSKRSRLNKIAYSALIASIAVVFAMVLGAATRFMTIGSTVHWYGMGVSIAVFAIFIVATIKESYLPSQKCGKSKLGLKYGISLRNFCEEYPVVKQYCSIVGQQGRSLTVPELNAIFEYVNPTIESERSSKHASALKELGLRDEESA